MYNTHKSNEMTLWLCMQADPCVSILVGFALNNRRRKRKTKYNRHRPISCGIVYNMIAWKLVCRIEPTAICAIGIIPMTDWNALNIVTAAVKVAPAVASNIMENLKSKRDINVYLYNIIKYRARDMCMYNIHVQSKSNAWNLEFKELHWCKVYFSQAQATE